MHERFGEKDQAFDCYRKALQNWKHADRDHPHAVHARQRLHNLTK